MILGRPIGAPFFVRQFGAVKQEDGWQQGAAKPLNKNRKFFLGGASCFLWKVLHLPLPLPVLWVPIVLW